MAFHTYPIVGTNDLVAWQRMGLMEGPDRVGDDVLVSFVSPSVVRLGIGMFRIAGFTAYNDAPMDFTIVNNVSGSTKIDRLILRCTITSSTVDIQPVVIRGSGPIGPNPLSKTLGVGTYEIAVARWAVLNGSAVGVAPLVMDGPGPGNVTFRHLAYSLNGGTSRFSGLANDVIYRAGPQPCSIDGTNLFFSEDGRYTIEYSVSTLTAFPSDDAYISLPVYSDTIIEPLGGRNRCRIVHTERIAANTSIEPVTFYTGPDGLSVDVTIHVTRLAA